MGKPSFEVSIWRADRELNHLHYILHEVPLANEQRIHEAIEHVRAELKKLRKFWRDEVL
jgi:hypothetical protein